MQVDWSHLVDLPLACLCCLGQPSEQGLGMSPSVISPRGFESCLSYMRTKEKVSDLLEEMLLVCGEMGRP